MLKIAPRTDRTPMQYLRLTDVEFLGELRHV